MQINYFMEYIIIKKRSISHLEKAVAKKIAEGWKPLGGAFHDNSFTEEEGCYADGVCQTMIREEKKE